MDMRCIISNKIIKEGEVYAILLAVGEHESRPVTLPFIAENNYSTITIKDEFVKEYLKGLENTGDLNVSFDEIEVFNPYGGDELEVTIKTTNQTIDFLGEETLGEEYVQKVFNTPLRIACIDKEFYDTYTQNIKNINYEGKKETYTEFINNGLKQYYSEVEVMKILNGEITILSNSYGNYKKFYSSINSKYEKIESISEKLYSDESEQKEFYAKGITLYSTKLGIITEIIEETTTMEIIADINNYSNSRFCNYSEETTKEEILNFSLICLLMSNLGLSFKTNSMVIDYNKGVMFNEFLTACAS